MKRGKIKKKPTGSVDRSLASKLEAVSRAVGTPKSHLAGEAVSQVIQEYKLSGGNISGAIAQNEMDLERRFPGIKKVNVKVVLDEVTLRSLHSLNRSTPASFSQVLRLALSLYLPLTEDEQTEIYEIWSEQIREDVNKKALNIFNKAIDQLSVDGKKRVQKDLKKSLFGESSVTA